MTLIPDEYEVLGDLDTAELVERLAQRLEQRGWMMASAESCTGGLIAARCTDRAGSSVWFERGFITYSNQAKTELLGVDAALIATHGAVSEEVAHAMAVGALAHSAAQAAVAVTGVAGPSGGTADKPVGTVWFGWNLDGQMRTERRRFEGDRATIRDATVKHALLTLVQLLNGPAT